MGDTVAFRQTFRLVSGPECWARVDKMAPVWVPYRPLSNHIVHGFLGSRKA
jgi:hypothetical protein